jgi:adenylate cyclase
MGKEIERKFLVIGQRWKEGATAVRYRQAYLTLCQTPTKFAVGPPVAVRIRIATVCQNTTNCGPEAFLTIKKSTLDITRDEFEYPIPIEDAEAMLNGLCEGDPIEKVRYKVTYGGMLWEIDVFEGANEGLVVAEIELSHPDQDFERPPWLGEEVSGDPRYLNTSLSRNPYSQWPHSLSNHDKLC